MNLRSQSTNDNGDLIVGRIISSHGVRGVVKLEPISDNPHRFVKGGRFFTGAKKQELIIESLSPDGKGLFLVKFLGIDDRDAADTLRNSILTIPKEEAGTLKKGEYYFWQLVGLEVRENGDKIGVIKQIIPNLANDLYVMEKVSGGEVLIPALKSVIKEIDTEKGVMTVELPPGLDE